MTAGLDYLKPYADTGTSSSARKIEERRHGGWLLELERAMLANEVTTSPRHHNSAEKYREADDSRNESRLLSSSGASVATGPASSPAGTSAFAADDAEHTASATHSRCDVSAGQGENAPARKAAQPALDHGGQSDAVLQRGTWYSESGISPVFNQVDAVYRLQASQQAGNQRDDIVRTVAHQTGQSIQSPLQGGLAGGQSRVPEHSAEPGLQSTAEEAMASPEVEPLQDSDAYVRRKLHLFHSDDGVHAWIRDVDVTESGVHAIAGALNSELAASGLKLAALTLNGKKLANLFQDGQRDEQGHHGGDAASGVTDADKPSSQPTQSLKEKGAY